MKLLNTLLVFLVCLFLGCSKKQSLGTKSHIFGKKGKHVVWIQVPGLALEQLALLKLTKETTDQKVSFESFECLGNLWSYNLYNLRPDAFKGLLSQTLGSKNITGTCNDFVRKSVWRLFQESGYEIGLLESPNYKSPSMVDFLTCPNELNPFKDIFIWSQRKGKGSFSSFHYQEGTGLKEEGLYFDKSCQKGKCYVSFRTNVEKMWEQFQSKNSRTFFVVRNLEIQNALDQKNIPLLKEVLYELDKTVSFFQEKMKKESLLLVLSSSGGVPITLPSEGKSWASYEK
ncbi:MAG: hypothetical protein NXH75_14440, partial [Halobacteriovoraceae bacterium]|nr:hypothetical protein [Halobacteriovoraceae bacterium]